MPHQPSRPLHLHPDRFLPADPRVRAIARRLHTATATLPIVSPHGHVDPRVLLDDQPFADPAALFITPDHYVTRLLHADGVDLADLGVGAGPLTEAQARRAWRVLCERWDVFLGTPVRAWLEHELADVFGLDQQLSAATADATYDHLADRLARDDHRPRALYARFGISVLATTDDPCSDLAVHAALDADPTWTGRVVPTFRPDRYLEAGRPDWPDAVHALGEAADIDTTTYDGYVAALEARRQHFIAHGATATDHSHPDVGTEPLDALDAARIHRAALTGDATQAEAVAFRRHMLGEMARMSCDDGLAMAIHPGVWRNHHPPTAAAFGHDTGHDIPRRVDFTGALQPLLARYGTHPNLHLVLFTLDESTWSRELAPLAGFYPSVFVGTPWWFLDAPDAIGRFHRAVTETAGFSRLSGFVDDTRAFCSIPARHDMARRIDAGTLARLVAEHRLDEADAGGVATTLATTQPRQVFKL